MSTDYNVWRERAAEVESNWGPSAYQSNALPLGQTGSRKNQKQTFYEIVCVLNQLWTMNWIGTKSDMYNFKCSQLFDATVTLKRKTAMDD